MTVVALSAAYGAGGSRVGPALANRLGVPFLDRAIPFRGSERLRVPLEEDAVRDEEGPGWLERVLSGFVGGDASTPAPVPSDAALTGEDFREATEQALLERAASGEGVILGRAAVFVLRDDPRVLRVRLDGPPERRVRLAVELGGLDVETAWEALRRSDRTHAAYARQFYGGRLDDASLYHVKLDSTAIDLETCVEILAQAARSLA
jgi:cytidylate kinase